jgi:hypothetical protein
MNTMVTREKIVRTDGSVATFFTITAPGLQVCGCYPPAEAESAIDGYLEEANLRVAVEVMKNACGSTRGCIVT